MPGMGPAPKHPDHRARRNRQPQLQKLPAEGRKGRAPKWPLGADVALELEIKTAEHALRAAQADEANATTARQRAAAKRRAVSAMKDHTRATLLAKAQRKAEADLWRELWRLPQAVQWERNGTGRAVAQYVRHTLKAELAGSIRDAAEARQLADRVGLTDLALLRLRWEIPTEAERQAPARGARARERYANLKCIDPGLPHLRSV